MNSEHHPVKQGKRFACKTIVKSCVQRPPPPFSFFFFWGGSIMYLLYDYRGTQLQPSELVKLKPTTHCQRHSSERCELGSNPVHHRPGARPFTHIASVTPQPTPSAALRKNSLAGGSAVWAWQGRGLTQCWPGDPSARQTAAGGPGSRRLGCSPPASLACPMISARSAGISEKFLPLWTELNHPQV